jgi:hypothetical protein
MAHNGKITITRGLLFNFLALFILFSAFGGYVLYGMGAYSNLTRTIYDHPYGLKLLKG